MTLKQNHKDNEWGILQLWLNWLAGSGAITILAVLSLWIKAIYMPFLAFGLEFLMFILIRRNRAKRIPSCYILPFIASRVLFWTGFVMIVINILYSNLFVDKVFDLEEINREIPFITVLITAPIATVISGWGWLNRRNISFCRDCRMRHGTPAERGFLGTIFTQVGRYQIGMLFWLSVIRTAVGWGYYLLTYNNSELNRADIFVFFWFPALLWLVAAVYLGMRYLGIWGYYQQNVEGSLKRRGPTTQLRFILIYDKYIAVRIPESDSDKKIDLDEKYDTPVSTFTTKVNDMSLLTAERYFETLSGVSDVEVRFMYSNIQGNADCNIFHYLCFFNDSQRLEFDRLHPDCRWMPVNEIANLINSNQTVPLFSAEIVRLHRVATTWKTYDENGRRRYKIKHYRPTFHVDDIRKWDVDYNDPRWLYVADNNQDTPFYVLRRFWRRYINGVGE